MQIAHQALEPLIEHMRIDLCRRNVRMAEQHLHHAQIGAIVKEVAGKSVAKSVGCDLERVQARAEGQSFQLAGKMLAGDMPTPAG